MRRQQFDMSYERTLTLAAVAQPQRHPGRGSALARAMAPSVNESQRTARGEMQ